MATSASRAPAGSVAEAERRFAAFPDYLDFCPFACADSLPISASGELEPGSYVLEAHLDGYGLWAYEPGADDCSSTVLGSYDVALLVPSVVPGPSGPFAAVLAAGLVLTARRRTQRET
jgi:hypothetical protein